MNYRCIRHKGAVMRSNELYNDLLDRLNCGVLVVTPDRKIQVWNNWMTSVSGIAQEDAAGMPFATAFPDVDEGRVGRAVDAALAFGRSAMLSASLHQRPLLTSREAPPHTVTVHAIAGAEPRALIVVRDVSAEHDFASRVDAFVAENSAQRKALRREKDRYTHVTHFDPVTGLANRHKVRSYLHGALDRTLAQDGMGALVMLDIDHFADVNNSIGAGAADKVLRLVATRLAETVRPVDTVARLGGDEFVVVLDGIASIDEAQGTAERLLNAFDQPFVVAEREIFLTASIGVTVFPFDDCTADRLLINAETAVGVAKKQGSRGFQMYSGHLDTEADERLALHTALRHAVDNGEFMLVYQPQVGDAGQALVGVEALLRWMHPERGMVSPAEFIPLLEESGLITQVGSWVLKEACRQGVEWRNQGFGDVRISVNVSARQFRGNVLQESVRRALRETGFPAGHLELELTESLLMRDVESSNLILAELKGMGVAIAIDDFGTGYSSLAYLRRFPVDTLKIDRAFCRNITVSAEDLSICKMIISLGKALELNVLAEGIESQAQLDLLEKVGCCQYQGFHFGRPMLPHQITAWIEERSHRVPDDILDMLASTSTDIASLRPDEVPPATAHAEQEPSPEYR